MKQSAIKSVDGVTSPGTKTRPGSASSRKKHNAQKKRSKLQLPKAGKKLLVIGAVVIVALVAVWFFALRSSELSNEQVVENVASLVSDLPQNESPTIATVEDAEALTSQDGFYAGSETGDKVLVYPQSKRAIIYRPATNSVIKDGSVSVSE